MLVVVVLLLVLVVVVALVLLQVVVESAVAWGVWEAEQQGGCLLLWSPRLCTWIISCWPWREGLPSTSTPATCLTSSSRWVGVRLCVFVFVFAKKQLRPAKHKHASNLFELFKQVGGRSSVCVYVCVC